MPRNFHIEVVEEGRERDPCEASSVSSEAPFFILRSLENERCVFLSSPHFPSFPPTEEEMKGGGGGGVGVTKSRSQDEKLLVNAADDKLIGNFASEEREREKMMLLDSLSLSFSW